MNSGKPDPQGGGPGDSRDKWITIDRLCDAYEASLQEGEVERGAYLAGVPPEWREQLTLELDAIDASYRDSAETRDQTLEAGADEFCHRRLPRQKSLDQLAELDSDRVWLGRFEIRKRLGTGATGSVWCARDARLARWVALKVPHASRVMSETAAGRFQTEARAAAAITHPNVVQVHEVLIEEGLPILVQQWIDGPSLAQFLKDNGAMKFEKAADWMMQIADAVACAHSRGIVHRDLKPANVMLNQNRPMVLDFGLASYPQLSSGLTTEGAVLGTPAYMSPEQAEGAENATEPSTDIYALGAMLYEMLVGTPPFVGTAREVLHACKHQMPVPPRNRRSAIPRDLETIVLRCLAKTPASRYRSAAEVRDDLRRFQNREPIHARKVSAFENALAWCRLHPAYALLTIGVPLVLFLVIGMVVSQMQRRHLSDRAEKLAKENLASRSQRQELVKQRQMIELSRASYQLSEGDRTRGLNILNSVPGPMRGWEWDLLFRMSNSPASLINAALPAEQRDVAYRSLARAPSRRRVFSAAQNGAIVQWRLPADRTLFLSEEREQRVIGSPEVMFVSPYPLNALGVSPDERWLCWADDKGGIGIWDLEENELKQRFLREEVGPGYAVAFSPDSRTFVVGGGSNARNEFEKDAGSWIMSFGLDEHDAFQRRKIRRWERRDAITSLCFSSPQRLYLSRGRSESKPGAMGYVEQWRCFDGALEYESQVWRGQGMRGLDYDETTQRIAWCDLAGMVFLKPVSDPVSLEPLQFQVAVGAASQVRFSPDGTQLVITGENGVVSCWAIPSSQAGPSSQAEQSSKEKATKAPNSDSKEPADRPSDSEDDKLSLSVSTDVPEASATKAAAPATMRMGKVRHLRDYRGHAENVRDAIFLWPVQRSKSKWPPNRLKRTVPILISCGDDGKVFQWSDVPREDLVSVNLGERGLIDTDWVSANQLVGLTGASKRTIEPLSRRYSISQLGIDADVRRVPAGRFVATQPFDAVKQSEPAVFAVGTARSLEVMQVGRGKRLTQRFFPGDLQGEFTAACWCNPRYLIAAVSHEARKGESSQEDQAAEETPTSISSLWIYDTGQEIEPQKLPLPEMGEVRDLLLSEDATALYGCCSDGNAFRVDLPSWPDEAFVWDEAVVRSWPVHRRRALGMTWVHGQQRLATVGEDGTYAIWDLAETPPGMQSTVRWGSGRSEKTLQRPWAPPRLQYRLRVGGDSISHVTCTSDGERLVTAGADRVIRIWDTETGLELISFPPLNERIVALRLSAQDRLLLIGHASGSVQLVRLRPGSSGNSTRGSGATDVADSMVVSP